MGEDDDELVVFEKDVSLKNSYSVYLSFLPFSVKRIFLQKLFLENKSSVKVHGFQKIKLKSAGSNIL